MSWFARAFGFDEAGYAETQAQFEVEGTGDDAVLLSKPTGARYVLGRFDTPSVSELCARALAPAAPPVDVPPPRATAGAGTGAGEAADCAAAESVAAGDVPPGPSPPSLGRCAFSVISDDVRSLHTDGRNAGAVFQVASQFNALEMVGPDVRPEDGVTRYASDPTQGPACAISCPAGTVFRNYLCQVGLLGCQRLPPVLVPLCGCGHVRVFMCLQVHVAACARGCAGWARAGGGFQQAAEPAG